MINEEAPPSDHSALASCTKHVEIARRHNFRFENGWLRELECRNLIKKSKNHGTYIQARIADPRL